MPTKPPACLAATATYGFAVERRRQSLVSKPQNPNPSFQKMLFLNCLALRIGVGSEAGYSSEFQVERASILPSSRHRNLAPARQFMRPVGLKGQFNGYLHHIIIRRWYQNYRIRE